MRKILTVLIGIIAFGPLLCSITNAGTFVPKHIAAVIVVDVSGSMLESDPNNVAIDGARLFVDLMEEKGSRAAVVTFDHKIRNVFGFTELNHFEQHRQFNADLDGIANYDGDTDIGLALKYAYELLDAQQLDENTSPLVILFTDGRLDVPTVEGRNQADSENDINTVLGKYPVYTIGLNYNDDVDVDLLRRVSSVTSAAQPLITKNPEELISFFNAIFAYSTDAKRVSFPFHLKGIREEDRVEIFVPELVREMSITITSDKPLGSGTELYSPSGSPFVERGRAFYSASEHYTVIKVVNPVSGNWVLGIDGEKGTYVSCDLVMQFDVGISLGVNPEGSAKPGDIIEITADIELPENTDVTAAYAAKEFNTVKLFIDGVEVGNMYWNGTSFVYEYECTREGDYYAEVIASGDNLDRTDSLVFSVGLYDVDMSISTQPLSDIKVGDTVTVMGWILPPPDTHLHVTALAEKVLLTVGEKYYGEMRWEGTHYTGTFVAETEGTLHISITASGSKMTEKTAETALHVLPADVDIILEMDKDSYYTGETAFLKAEALTNSVIDESEMIFQVADRTGKVFTEGVLIKSNGSFSGSFLVEHIGELIITVKYKDHFSNACMIISESFWIAKLKLICILLSIILIACLVLWFYQHRVIRRGIAVFVVSDSMGNSYQTYEIPLRGYRNGVRISKLRIFDKLVDNEIMENAEMLIFNKALSKISLRRIVKNDRHGSESGFLKLKKRGNMVLSRTAIPSGRDCDIRIDTLRRVSLEYRDHN